MTNTRAGAATGGGGAAGRTGQPGARTDGGQTTAGAVQLAIGLLALSLDSPQLQAWAVEALIPQDAEGPGDFMAGLHVVSQMLLH